MDPGHLKLHYAWLLLLISCMCSIHHSNQTLDTLKLGLQHIDFTKPNATHTQKMINAVTRSHSRSKLFNRMVSDSVASSYETLVVAGQGAFITTVAMGTPTVSFTAIVDTGSDLIWRQCKPCIYCYTQSSGTIFDPSQSSTYSSILCNNPLCTALPQTGCVSMSSPCTYIYGYGDLSYTSGVLSFDKLTLQDMASDTATTAIPNVAFGCSYNNENSNFAGAGGLIALGQGRLSLSSQLLLSQFSYCLQSITDPSSKLSPLFLGPAPVTTSAPMSTPIITNPTLPSLYYVGLNGISVNGTLLPIPASAFAMQSDGSGGTIIDSGTTLTYLTEEAYSAVLEAFEALVMLPKGDGSLTGLDLCYTQEGEVPSLALQFEEGGQLEVPSQNYFISMEGLFCLAMAESGTISILGNILQQNFHVVYDRSELKLSMSAVTCDSLQ